MYSKQTANNEKCMGCLNMSCLHSVLDDNPRFVMNKMGESSKGWQEGLCEGLLPESWMTVTLNICCGRSACCHCIGRESISADKSSLSLAFYILSCIDRSLQTFFVFQVGVGTLPLPLTVSTSNLELVLNPKCEEALKISDTCMTHPALAQDDGGLVIGRSP